MVFTGTCFYPSHSVHSGSISVADIHVPCQLVVYPTVAQLVQRKHCEGGKACALMQ